MQRLKFLLLAPLACESVKQKFSKASKLQYRFQLEAKCRNSHFDKWQKCQNSCEILLGTAKIGLDICKHYTDLCEFSISTFRFLVQKVIKSEDIRLFIGGLKCLLQN